MVLRLLAAAVATAGVALADWSDGDPGWDRFGLDLRNFNMTTNTTKECFDSCTAAAPDCVGWAMIPAGSCNSGGPAVCFLKGELVSPSPNPCRISGPMPSAFQPPLFLSQPVGAMLPTGWLADELLIQAHGLSGALAQFWPDINASVWIGGGADGGLHERGPYWLNGIVPLSFQTGDPTVTAQRDLFINYILNQQLPSGWMGPDDMANNGDEYWSRFNVLQSLTQYWEATQNPRVIPAIFAYLAEARRRMATTSLGDWSVVRAQDFILTLFWLVDNYDRINVPTGFSQAYLIDLAEMTHDQMLSGGGDWKSWFDGPSFPTGPACVPNAPCNLLTHGVNIAQAIKSEAVWYRRSQDLTDVASTYIRMEKLDKYHGAPSGVLQADEHLAGAMPSHGTELCGVVEAIFSYAVCGSIIGDPRFFERAELIAYNALPATITKDWWAHQYLQQANEANAIISDPHVWFTDGDQATLFGLEPNYGCCTANMHQGWPKFAQRLVQAPLSGGVAITMWGPSTTRVNTTDAGIVTVNITTDYPFGDVATVTVAAAAPGLALQLRIPSWATAATLTVNGGAAQPVGDANGTFYSLTLPAAYSTVVVNFNPAIRLQAWYNGSVAVLRGGLLYGLQIGENFTTLAVHPLQSKDYAITPTTPWNVALVVDPSNPAASLTFQQVSPPSPVPYNSTVIPVMITGQGRLVQNWGLDQNAAAAPPASPACTQAGACGDLMPIKLVPFGSTHLRMAQMPYTLS